MLTLAQQPDPKTGRKPKARSPPRTANPTIRPFVITKRTAHRAKNRIKQKLVKGLAVSESLLVQAQAPVQPPSMLKPSVIYLYTSSLPSQLNPCVQTSQHLSVTNA